MIPREFLAAFAPIGFLQGPDRWRATGACVFFAKPPFVWIVTAGHVLDIAGPEATSVLLTPPGGGTAVVAVGQILAGTGISWVRDPSNDLAAAPMPSPDQWGIKAIPANLCMPLKELIPSMPCFTVGCPYGMYGVDGQKPAPLVLDGVISGTDLARGRVYTSAPTFPGNSGGPLIVVRGLSDDQGNVWIGRFPVVLAGIMLEMRLAFSPDSSDRTPPLHLGVAVPTDAIISLLDSEAARALVTQFGPK